MVNTAICLICYLNIIIIAETQLRHNSEKNTFDERPRHLLNFVTWGKAPPGCTLPHKTKFDK